HRGEKTRTLAHEDQLAGLFLRVEQAARVFEIVDQRLGADDMFAGVEALADVFRMERVRGIDADGVDLRAAQHVGELRRVVGKSELRGALLAELRVQTANARQLPQFTVDRRRDDAPAVAKAKDAEP